MILMKVFSVIYRPDIDTYYLYGKEGKRIFPEPPQEPGLGVRYGFSFHDEYNHPLSVLWGQFLSGLELEEGCEYFRQAELGTGNMQDITARVTSYWLDRGKTESPPLPNLVLWSREMMVDPQRHTDKVSKIYLGKEAVAAVETIFARYRELVEDRKHQNYGHFWPNAERINLLELRLKGMKFPKIGEAMGRTAAACRSEYGRIRRGEDSVTLELQDWDILREALPLGMFPSRKETTLGTDSESDEEDRVEPVLHGEGLETAAG
jgi:hypothetical protein